MDDPLLPWLNGPSADFLADPYPVYHRLRNEAPVHQGPDQDWFISRFADVTRVLTDRRFCRQSPGGASPFSMEKREPTILDRMFEKWMFFMDPPAHTRMSKIVGPYFKPERIKAMRPHIAEVTEDLLDGLGDAGSMDVVADLAFPLSIIVISELLGVPVEDRDMFKEATGQLAKAIDRGMDEDMAAAVPATEELTAYFGALVAERRKRPQDDMLSHLIAAQEQDGSVSDEEIVATCAMIISAGHETTKNLIASGLLALLRWPQQLEALRRDPALIESAVEEFLRFDGPVQKVSRWTTEDVEIGGRVIPKHNLVINMFGPANRDPDRFADPDRLDISRGESGHLAFGRGIHHCTGSLLARIEAQTAIGTLLARTRRLTLHEAEVEWLPTTSIRGPKFLPLSFENA